MSDIPDTPEEAEPDYLIETTDEAMARLAAQAQSRESGTVGRLSRDAAYGVARNLFGDDWDEELEEFFKAP